MFDKEGHYIDDPLMVINYKIDFDELIVSACETDRLIGIKPTCDTCKSYKNCQYYMSKMSVDKELKAAAEEYSLGHSVRKECFIDGALWMKEKMKRNDTKD